MRNYALLLGLWTIMAIVIVTPLLSLYVYIAQVLHVTY